MEALAAYFWMIGLEDLDLREAWLVMIQAMDQAWLEHQARQSDGRQAQGEGGEAKKHGPETKQTR